MREVFYLSDRTTTCDIDVYAKAWMDIADSVTAIMGSDWQYQRGDPDLCFYKLEEIIDDGSDPSYWITDHEGIRSPCGYYSRTLEPPYKFYRKVGEACFTVSFAMDLINNERLKN